MSELSVEGNQQTVIFHLYADYGVEGEALAAYGDVHRFTIDPKPNPVYETTTAMDLMTETPERRAHLAVLHPKCSKWTDMPNVDPDDHENQIPRARELANSIADNYIIENKPRAPLRDPVVLNGKQFGLPIKYERAFETSFSVRAPPRERTLKTECGPYYYSDRTTEWWKSVKGVRGDYPKQHLAKNALPLAYVDVLLRAWLRSVNERDGKKAQDNNGPSPRSVEPDQAKITEVSNRV
ncbi:hypothetical protein [Haladaptatus sp. DYF46]|uniref:hypothetical protein n=1 Tax=Haladaptatus sp. DYF46 TaxID=2886041 RepID=UPI001E3FB3A7|nr:hypothetical protein [Haladaptatus sp. DYF46]